ncbi:FAD-dependent oxidoreductase [Streptomyces sp. NPDC056333]|uniref:FAD-dependent oxidoreductase n=1 Tax=Streptomyces sp. NPDC056333 TaxID=3345786 RepID=UPI0035E1DB8E
MDNHTYDVIVIGAGPVREDVADRVVQGGLSAAVVEREPVGGECSYWACMPTKALLRSAAALRAAGQVPGSREVVTGDVDLVAVLCGAAAADEVAASRVTAGVRPGWGPRG